MTSHPSIGQLATLACILEATAPKPGNVHPGAMFSDLKFRHFLASAIAIGPHMELARFLGVGQTVLDAITSTQQCVSTNTNLGMVLLLAPLAAVPREQSVEQGINKVLSLLNAKDSQQVYAAINLAKPGGMGTSHSHDLSAPAPDNLLWAMQAASDRDMVARQYCNDFADVIHFIAPRIAELSSDGHDLLTVIVATHVEVMS
ncbi:MAG: triphosphoribosyl-dephospho-CoA synthase, partial [Planctomycetales bacterium]|nr:triphosphoribosyl-dephospho-CoA synthase [Planctomycetales bacterium]